MEFKIDTFTGMHDKKELPPSSILNILYPYGPNDFKAKASSYDYQMLKRITNNDVASVKESLQLGMEVTPKLLYFAQKLALDSSSNQDAQLIYKLLKKHYNAKRVNQPEALDAECEKNIHFTSSVEKHYYTFHHLQFLPQNIQQRIPHRKPKSNTLSNSLLFAKPQKVTQSITWHTDEYERNSVFHGYKPEIDKKWLELMDQYLLGLPRSDLLMLWAYSKEGDMLVNTFLRYHKTNPQKVMDAFSIAQDIPILFIPWKKMHHVDSGSIADDLDAFFEYFTENEVSDEEKMTLIHFCCKEIQRLILESPATTQPMTVYRGLKTIWWEKPNTQHQTLQVNGFLSTSLSASTAQGFTDHATVCCLKRILLPKGSHGLFLNGVTMKPTELEVLLPYNSEFLLLDEKMEYSYTPDFNITDKDRSYLCESKVDSQLVITLQMVVNDNNERDTKLSLYLP